jgi:phosphoribosylformimino-5-aminoimidazole carboxamide ribotide isomerase
MLGPGNESAVFEAIRAFPGRWQVGGASNLAFASHTPFKIILWTGGITPDNGLKYLEAGASHVIVTSYAFQEGRIDWVRLDALKTGKALSFSARPEAATQVTPVVFGKDRLVLDLSCRKRPSSGPGDAAHDYLVVTDRWQTFTDVTVTPDTLATLSTYCSEFLIHGVDVEGLQLGVEVCEF